MDNLYPTISDYILTVAVALPFNEFIDDELLKQTLLRLRKACDAAAYSGDINIYAEEDALFSDGDYSISPTRGTFCGDSYGTATINWSQFETLMLTDATIVKVIHDKPLEKEKISKIFAEHISHQCAVVISSCIKLKPIKR